MVQSWYKADPRAFNPLWIGTRESTKLAGRGKSKKKRKHKQKQKNKLGEQKVQKVQISNKVTEVQKVQIRRTNY